MCIVAHGESVAYRFFLTFLPMSATSGRFAHSFKTKHRIAWQRAGAGVNMGKAEQGIATAWLEVRGAPGGVQEATRHGWDRGTSPPLTRRRIVHAESPQKCARRYMVASSCQYAAPSQENHLNDNNITEEEEEEEDGGGTNLQIGKLLLNLRALLSILQQRIFHVTFAVRLPFLILQRQRGHSSKPSTVCDAALHGRGDGGGEVERQLLTWRSSMAS